VKIHFSSPGKVTDNAFIESSNGTFRDKSLNTNWFETLVDEKQILDAWREEYSESRPHRPLGESALGEFASHFAACREMTAT
jgi:putative transposase